MPLSGVGSLVNEPVCSLYCGDGPGIRSKSSIAPNAVAIIIEQRCLKERGAEERDSPVEQ